MFFKGSRYENVPDNQYTDASGRTIVYKLVRYIAPTPPVQGHKVVAEQRLDAIAQQYYRDPERFWRICDANLAMWPDDLLELGQIIGIPTSEG